jgi:hypothetical protein
MKGTTMNKIDEEIIERINEVYKTKYKLGEFIRSGRITSITLSN